jgi:opacity protein-like surface antigen
MSPATRPRGPDRPETNALSDRALCLAAVALVTLALASCAQDAWKPNPNFSAFLNQVERNCGTSRIGELTVSQLMNPGSAQSSAYFIDMTSRFDLGRISEEDYVLGVSSTFNTVRNSAGIRCILAQKTQ